MFKEEILCTDGKTAHIGDVVKIKHKYIGIVTGMFRGLEECLEDKEHPIRIVIEEDTGTLLRLFTGLVESIEILDRHVSEDKMVSHPPHYQSKSGLEVLTVIEAFTEDLKGIEAVDTGNIIKYICRWKKKNGLQDLNKAEVYLQHLIKHVEKESELS